MGKQATGGPRGNARENDVTWPPLVACLPALPTTSLIILVGFVLNIGLSHFYLRFIRDVTT